MGIIKNHLTKLARNAVGGALGNAISGALSGGFNNKIAGSAAALGKNKARLASQSQEVFEENEYAFGTVSYPLDLKGGGGTSNGHYMIFYIQVPIEEGVDSAGSTDITQVIPKELGSVKQMPIRRLNKSVTDRQEFKRISSAITLYMPPEIKAEYKMEYSEESIGGAARNLLDEFDFGKQFKASVGRSIVKGLDMAAPGMAAIRQAETGLAVNNRVELQFQKVENRTFSYTFNFKPKNREEADEIQRIIYLFKYHMHPTIIGGVNSPVFRVPSQFSLHYMYRSDENKYLNTIGETILENMDVTYGDGTSFKTYRGNDDGAPPETITLTLSFKEMDVHDKSTIYKHETPPDRRNNLSAVNQDQKVVGYNGPKSAKSGAVPNLNGTGGL
tara:strand:+ start:930 stop:2090 length:1161 start_codon:yes stop_codon:yes gene_type:complete